MTCPRCLLTRCRSTCDRSAVRMIGWHDLSDMIGGARRSSGCETSPRVDVHACLASDRKAVFCKAFAREIWTQRSSLGRQWHSCAGAAARADAARLRARAAMTCVQPVWITSDRNSPVTAIALQKNAPRVHALGPRCRSATARNPRRTSSPQVDPPRAEQRSPLRDGTR
jgi:hypothetical protein